MQNTCIIPTQHNCTIRRKCLQNTRRFKLSGDHCGPFLLSMQKNTTGGYFQTFFRRAMFWDNCAQVCACRSSVSFSFYIVPTCHNHFISKFKIVFAEKSSVVVSLLVDLFAKIEVEALSTQIPETVLIVCTIDENRQTKRKRKWTYLSDESESILFGDASGMTFSVRHVHDPLLRVVGAVPNGRGSALQPRTQPLRAVSQRPRDPSKSAAAVSVIRT